MKKIFFLSLLSVALYSCSNDDFDVTSNNTGSYMETIESKSNLVLENGLDNSLTDSLKLDDFKKGIWSVFGDADNLLEKVKPQGLYVISYSTVGEILNSSKRWISLVDKEFTNSPFSFISK